MKDPVALILSVCFNIFLAIMYLYGRRDKRTEYKSKLTEEMIAINSLTIEHPELRQIYMQKSELRGNRTPLEENKLESFCYKYLNLLNKIDDYYSIVKHLKSQNAIKHFLEKEFTIWNKIRYKDPQYIRDWLIFYERSFNPKTVAFHYMKDIVSTDNIDKTGDYSTDFAKFTRLLLKMEKE